VNIISGPQLKTYMVGQKYFKRRRGKHSFGRNAKYTKYNKINNNSENFKGARLQLRNLYFVLNYIKQVKKIFRVNCIKRLIYLIL